MSNDTLMSVADKHYTVEEAARLLGRSRRQVYNYAGERGWRGTIWHGLRLFLKVDVEQTRRELDSK